MLTIKNGSMSNLADAILETGIIQDMSSYEVYINLSHLQYSTELFGEVDLRNHQQIELAAYRIKKGGISVYHSFWPNMNPNRFKLAIIGAGATAAYFLDTLGPAHDKESTLVIGSDNPWLYQRGHGIPYINHTERQIALPSENVTEYGGNESFVNRRAFGRKIESTIQNLAGKWHKRNIIGGKMGITRHYGLLKLQCDDPWETTYYAEKVVFVAGSGKKRKPNFPKELGARVIGMDKFIRDIAVQEAPQHGGQKKIAVWGSRCDRRCCRSSGKT